MSKKNTAPAVTLADGLRAMATGNGRPEIMADLGTGSTGAGGWTVPSTVTAEFIDRLRYQSILARSGATFIQLEPGENRMPTVTGDPTAQFLADGASQNETAITFGAADFDARTIRFVIKASREIFQDSPRLTEIVNQVAAGTAAQFLDLYALYGDGQGANPKGLIEYALAEYEMQAETNSTTLADFKPFTGIVRKIGENNGPVPTAFIMSPREFESVGNLTNDSFPITIVENNPDPGVRWLQSNAVKTDEIDGGNTDVSRIFAGHWPDLYVGIRQEMEIELLREKFSATNQVAFLCSMRADVIPVRQGSFGMITGIRPDGAS